MTEQIMMDGKPLEVGDEVYCLLHGKGKVSNINKKVTFSIEVAFSTFSNRYYSYTATFKGWTNHENRTLYWLKPEIIPPPRPKKKVKVWDWFVQWDDSGLIDRVNGTTMKDLEDRAERRGMYYSVVQKIEGTEREVER